VISGSAGSESAATSLGRVLMLGKEEG
jgi:hypothetical protein